MWLPRFIGPVKPALVFTMRTKPLIISSTYTEAAGLRTVTVDADVVTVRGLDNGLDHHRSVIRMHAWPLGVENAHNLDIHVVLALVIEEQSSITALTFVLTRARANGVDATQATF